LTTLKILGVIAFALSILISVSLHEAGHMVTAKAFGMKVTRYFVGFGPTLWSFRRGETEYGLKGIPLGGFVKIVGMTQDEDDVEPADEPRAMWRFPVWKRTIVMSAGSAVHFLLAALATWILAMTLGLPNPAIPQSNDEFMKMAPFVKIASCAVVSADAPECAATDPASPAGKAGLRDGDRIVSLGGRPTPTNKEFLEVTRASKVGPSTISYERDGTVVTSPITLVEVQRRPLGDPKGPVTKAAAIGVGLALDPSIKPSLTYGPVDAVGATGDFIGNMATMTVASMKKLPSKVPALFSAIGGGERDTETPISVVGASLIGGELVQAQAWSGFVMLFISLNFFVGLFNLLPLLPLDGGHIAISWFERVRSWLYPKVGRRDPGRVDYAKMLPLTYGVILVFGAFTLLTVVADIVNPISLFR